MMPDHLKLLKVDTIKIHKPYFDPNPQKSTTNNHSWRVGLFVYFKDPQGRDYVWMPKWDELKEILQEKETVEMKNKELCKQNLAEECPGGMA